MKPDSAKQIKPGAKAAELADLFPGRTVLYVSEAAKALRVTEQHVMDLIEEGKLGAVNVGGGTRNFWRIPVAEFQKFLRRRNSLDQGGSR